MDITEALFDAINGGTPLFFGRDLSGLDIDKLARLLGPRLVQTSGQDYAVAMHKDDPSDCSDRTEYFDWHSDGLYHPVPPRHVLLHCIDPGTGMIATELAETESVLADIPLGSLRTLRKLRSHYVGHGGSFDHPIIMPEGMLLASRGHVDALPDLGLERHPLIRDIAAAFSDLYRALDAHAQDYQWQAGGTLVFDQYRYMHRRNSAGIDRKRKLIRMWFN